MTSAIRPLRPGTSIDWMMPPKFVIRTRMCPLDSVKIRTGVPLVVVPKGWLVIVTAAARARVAGAGRATAIVSAASAALTRQDRDR